MLTLLVAAYAMQAQAPIVPVVRPGRDGRGRDPWVFRCIFEDRTRMLVLAPAPDWWMAFNPETGALHKVWQGKMDFRGKVWDFSQDNSRAEGRIFLASPSEIWRFPDAATPPTGWLVNGMTYGEKGWMFDRASSTLTSPPSDLREWHRIFLAFDETGRKGRFHVNIADQRNRVAPQWFDSATSVETETSWQWNFKRLERPGEATVVTISSQVPGKRMRNLRLYGDRPAWFDVDGKSLDVSFGGYELIKQTKAVTIRYRLKLGRDTIAVQYRPDITKTGWQESWTIQGLPKGQKIWLRREGLSKAVRPSTTVPFENGGWVFTGNGEYRIAFDILESKQ